MEADPLREQKKKKDNEQTQRQSKHAFHNDAFSKKSLVPEGEPPGTSG